MTSQWNPLPTLRPVSTVLYSPATAEPVKRTPSLTVNRLQQLASFASRGALESMRYRLMLALDAARADGLEAVTCPQCGKVVTVDLDDALCHGHCTHCDQRGQ